MVELTAALDPVAGFEIYSKFNEIVGDKAVIYISHRLSSPRRNIIRKIKRVSEQSQKHKVYIDFLPVIIEWIDQLRYNKKWK